MSPDLAAEAVAINLCKFFLLKKDKMWGRKIRLGNSKYAQAPVAG